jgi:hypothetical protein
VFCFIPTLLVVKLFSFREEKGKEKGKEKEKEKEEKEQEQVAVF